MVEPCHVLCLLPSVNIRLPKGRVWFFFFSDLIRSLGFQLYSQKLLMPSSPPTWWHSRVPDLHLFLTLSIDFSIPQHAPNAPKGFPFNAFMVPRFVNDTAKLLATQAQKSSSPVSESSPPSSYSKWDRRRDWKSRDQDEGVTAPEYSSSGLLPEAQLWPYHLRAENPQWPSRHCLHNKYKFLKLASEDLHFPTYFPIFPAEFLGLLHLHAFTHAVSHSKAAPICPIFPYSCITSLPKLISNTIFFNEA